MDSSNQQTFEGLQAIHVEERKVFDALYSKEMRQIEMNFRWSQGRMSKMNAIQQRRLAGKRELEERQEQEISELRKVHAQVQPQAQTQARELQQKRAEQGRIRLQQNQERAARELQAEQGRIRLQHDQERAERELQAKRELQSMSKELLEMIMPQLKREMMRGYEDVSEQVESSANYIVSRMHN